MCLSLFLKKSTNIFVFVYMIISIPHIFVGLISLQVFLRIFSYDVLFSHIFCNFYCALLFAETVLWTVFEAYIKGISLRNTFSFCLLCQGHSKTWDHAELNFWPGVFWSRSSMNLVTISLWGPTCCLWIIWGKFYLTPLKSYIPLPLWSKLFTESIALWQYWLYASF